MSKTVRCYRFGAGAEAEGLKKNTGASFPNLVVQVFDSGVATNELLIEMLGAQTLQAAASGSALARKAEVDLLLRVAGTTQISEAIQRVGVKKTKAFLLVVAGDETDVERLESEEGVGWVRLQRSPLTRAELGRIEKAALLDAERA